MEKFLIITGAALLLIFWWKGCIFFRVSALSKMGVLKIDKTDKL
jgi:hypothetical protein